MSRQGQPQESYHEKGREHPEEGEPEDCFVMHVFEFTVVEVELCSADAHGDMAPCALAL